MGVGGVGGDVPMGSIDEYRAGGGQSRRFSAPCRGLSCSGIRVMTYVWVAPLGVMADHFGWRGGWWGAGCTTRRVVPHNMFE